MSNGFAGRVAKSFLNSKLTFLFVLVSLFVGILSVYMTPKEEEPQIKVPMIDVLIQVPGFSPSEIEKRVTNIVEREMSSLTNVKHVYSTSLESASLITVRFDVGQDLETSLVKIHHKVMGLKDRLPKESMNPIVKSYTIDDVPFYAITFFSKHFSSSELRYQIIPIAKKLQEVDGIAEYSIIGGERKVVKIIPDIKKLKDYGITIVELKDAVEKSSSAYLIGKIVERSPEPIIAVGPFSSNIEDIKSIPIGRRLGKTLILSDVASIALDFDRSKSIVEHGREFLPAITITYTKKKGTNATILAQELKEKLDLIYSTNLIPNIDKTNIQFEITRDYGATAKEKSNELLEHLLIATISVMVLMAIAMGVRISLIVGIAVPVTLAITLFIYYVLGYTLNRVTLFALIFSIGILVDDAIVVVENIYRHLALKKKNDSVDDLIIRATDEVGNPTILATFTVILAIMPMAFVGGLMGPYMRPIPIGASFAMIFSLFIAFIISPWATKKFVNPDKVVHHEGVSDSRLSNLFRKIMHWVIDDKKHSIMLGSIVVLMLMGSVSMVLFKSVKVKMLPFDNKSEFQILVDMPEGKTLDETRKFTRELSDLLNSHKEIKSIQTYIGTAAPFNFSGMVKHTFMRASSYKADLQVNLVDKHNRDIQGHDFVNALRNEVLTKLEPQLKNIKVKFLEIPPGPPVMSTLLGEVYHEDKSVRDQATKNLAEIYKSTDGVVETDLSIENGQTKINYIFDRKNGMKHGILQNYFSATMLMALGDLDIFLLHSSEDEEPVYLRMMLDENVKTSDKELQTLLIPSVDGDKVPLERVLKISEEKTGSPIYHKDLKNVNYVMAEVAGSEESPFYAILNMDNKLQDYHVTYTSIPDHSEKPILKWDGEMDITIEVFRDMGIAFFIAVILIMILVIGWYNSFVLPFVIILPIPLTLIGIIPGHYFMNSFFTATSMIGFIAGAGITVRNSIILVDFIKMKRNEGSDLASAVIESMIVRFRPILLTALAVLVAGFVIIFDPIFQGLAISLMSGSLISALLSIPLVPVLYYWIEKNKN